MVRRTLGILTLLSSIAALCGSLPAQTGKIVTVRALDSRTGELIATQDYLVRINHEQTVHADWVTKNEDGTGKLIVPDGATVLAVQARFDMGMSIFLNCDNAKDRQNPVARWYAVSDILTAGVAAPNGCGKRTAVAKPGEFVFFVHKQSWRQQMKDDSY
jgi:hypothetical protein